jgi:hypothetical protein
MQKVFKNPAELAAREETTLFISINLAPVRFLVTPATSNNLRRPTPVTIEEPTALK